MNYAAEVERCREEANKLKLLPQEDKDRYLDLYRMGMVDWIIEELYIMEEQQGQGDKAVE